MKLIIGLGNPGAQYEHTRHNVGFDIVDRLAEMTNFSPFNENAKFNAAIAEKIASNGEKILLVKPLTFMNRSGEVVATLMNFYKLTKNDIAVIHDDLDITLGEFKRVDSASAAGHNGVQNIIDRIGSQEFIRYRIGIEGTERKKTRTIPGDVFVLQKFTKEEAALLSLEDSRNPLFQSLIEEFLLT